MNKKIIDFRNDWENRPKKHLLDLKSAPKSDVNKKPDEIYENVKIRIKHLAKFVYDLYLLYNNNKDLYSDKFPAFVGNSVIREWPNKDFEFFTSEEWSKNTVLKTKPHIEHWTPISFFREIFLMEGMSEKDFYDALLSFYRVVKITQEENNRLNKKGYKITRPITAYKECDIKIHEDKLWNKLYDGLDKSMVEYIKTK